MEHVLDIAIPSMQLVFVITLALSILLLGPLALIRSTRHFSARGYILSSNTFAIMLWVLAVLLTYQVGGLFWTLFGIFLFVVGIIPIAFIGMLLHAEWGVLGDLLLLLIGALFFRALAFWLFWKIGATEV
jgi:hypothetical protein